MRLSIRRVVSILPPILLIAAAPALAAPAWKALGPFGGTVRTLTPSPSDPRVSYLTIEGEGAFRSLDGGASWVPIHRAFVSSNVAVHPSRPGLVYLATPEHKMLKSTDFGSHWTPAERGLEQEPAVTAVAVDPALPSRLYAGGLLGFFRSTDGGASWQPSREGPSASFDPEVKMLLALPKPAGTVLAVRDGKLYRSADAGDTWKALERGLPYGVIAVAASPSQPRTLYASLGAGGVFRSRDSGASWAQVASAPRSRVVSLAVALRSPNTVWAGTAQDGLQVSYDGGSHWKAASLRGVSGITVVALAPPSPQTVLVGTRSGDLDVGGVFASANGGATWQRRNRGLAGLFEESVGTDPEIPGGLWAFRRRGMWRSANGGQDWTLTSFEPDRQGVIRAVAASDPSVFYALSPRGLWRTTDGGRAWTVVLGGESLDMPWRSLWIDPANPTTLWSQTGGGLNRSGNGGATWMYRELPNPGEVTRLVFAPSSPATIYAAGSRRDGGASRATVWRSTDGGVTWSAAEQGLEQGGWTSVQALAVDPVDPRLLYLGACGYYCSPASGIWKSTDGGASWTLTGTGLEGHWVRVLAASPVAGLVWAAVEEGRVFRSGDGGETWREQSSGLYASSISQLTVDPQDPRRVYAATSTGVWVLEDEP